MSACGLVDGFETDGMRPDRAVDPGSVDPGTVEAGADPIGDPSAPLEIDADAYAEWTPPLRDVGAWTASDGKAMTERVEGAADREYTATFASTLALHAPVEVAHTPEHTRVRVGGEQWVMEVHLDELPDPTGERTDPHVVCVRLEPREDPGCVRLPPAERDLESPHLFGAFVDSWYYGSMTLLRAQSPDLFAWTGSGGTAAGPDPAHLFRSAVDSPAGELDCVGAVLDGTARDALEGQQVNLTGSPLDENVEPDDVDAPASNLTCVDSRGLVLVKPDFLEPVHPLLDYREGVDDDLTILPGQLYDYGDVPEGG
ncbi:hypothetical protein [Nocardioides sp. GXZ039]|uniref:hypothetical protein n=1 Tax=Nocardioides sp. GXZ039 TaxID=3136018 RepID=UPI0030F3AD45